MPGSAQQGRRADPRPCRPWPGSVRSATPRTRGGTLSVQEALASAGIDTFAPSLLGYGHSTTFTEGLDDPANASLPGFAPDGTCGTPERCDRTHNPNFEFDQQGKLLLRNPLDGQRRSHSSDVRFARIDVWVRDIGQVIDDAIAQAQPAGGKVTLVGHSLGAVRAGRSLNMVKFPTSPQRSKRRCSCHRSSSSRQTSRHLPRRRRRRRDLSRFQ